MSPDAERQPSRRVATAWNVVFAYGSVILALVRNLALVPVFLHFIDAREYGAWLATGGVLVFLLTVDFGLMGVVGQRTAQAYGAKDMALLGRRIGTSLVTATVISVLSAILAALASPWVPGLMRLTGEAADRLMISFLIVALAKGVNLLALASRAVLRSLQRPVIPGLSELVSEVAGIALTLVLLFDGRGLYALALGLALRSVLNAAINIVGCLWVSWRGLGLRLRWDRAESRALWGNSFYQFFASIALRLQSRSDAFFVGLILGPESALVYSLTLRAHETVRLIGTQFIASAQPSLAHLHGDGNTGRFREVVLLLVGIAAIISGIGMAGVVAFNGAFMDLWLGDPQIYGGLLLTTLMAVFGFVAEIGAAQYGTLMSLGQFRTLCGVSWVATLVRLPLLILLLALLGLTGAPLAAIAGALVQTWGLSASVAGLLQISGAEIRRVLAHILRATLPVAGLAALAVWLGVWPESWPGLILSAAAFSGVAVLIAALADRRFVRRLASEFLALRATARS